MTDNDYVGVGAHTNTPLKYEFTENVIDVTKCYTYGRC